MLLLGGTGTLSMGVLKEALNKGWDITVLNRGIHKKHIPDSVHRIIGDFKKVETWKEALHSCNFDVVVDFLSRNPADIKIIVNNTFLFLLLAFIEEMRKIFR